MILALVVSTLAWAAEPKAKKIPAPVSAPTPTLKTSPALDPAALLEAKCSRCHDGSYYDSKSGLKAPALDFKALSPMATRLARKSIANGSMPPEPLLPEEREFLLKYLDGKMAAGQPK